MTNPKVLTVAEVAARIHSTPGHVRRLLCQNVIPGFKKGRREWGVYQLELEAWINSRRNGAPVAADNPKAVVK